MSTKNRTAKKTRKVATKTGSSKKGPAKTTARPKVVTKTTSGENTATAEDAVEVDFTRKFLSRYAPLPDGDRAAFASQCSAEVADALGAQTNSDGVAADARRALKRGERMLAAYPGDIRYSVRRLTFLALAVRELEKKIARQKRDRAGANGSGPTAAAAESTARGARTDLVESLEEVLEGSEAFAADLAATRGHLQNRQGIIDSINLAIALARRVLKTGDPLLKVLIHEHGLSDGLVKAAADAGQRLQDAVDGKPDQGTANDSPEVNRAEGFVLFELRKLKRALDRAHARNNLVERYIPGPAVRAVLGGASSHAATTELSGAGGKSGGQPGTPAGGGPGTPTSQT
jgi:hypothetical protein